MEEQKRRKSTKNLITVLISLLMGLLGGIGGILLIANNSQIATDLGLDGNIVIPTTSTERMILEESNAIIDASEKVSPAVVSVVSTSVYQDIYGRSQESTGAGTGFIITNDGMIITNKHVVLSEDTTYKVVLADGTSYDAEVTSRDSANDIAVLKIDAKNLPVVELGDSDNIKVGQWVVAIGNALGKYQNTVTAGVISAKNRKVQVSEGFGLESMDGLLQTDTAINSGNSGGPLINLAGQVIGINTAVAEGAQGIGFAIPINTAKTAIDSIKETGRIVRPFLGVRYVQITKDIADQNSLAYDYGALVSRGSGLGQVAVIPGSPADKAGIVENDILLEVAGIKIDEDNSLVMLIQKHKVGDEIEIKVSSKGEEKTVKVKLEEIK